MSSAALSQLTRQFRSLFNGRTDAYGLRHGQVVRSALSDREVAKHLSGRAIGVFPLLDDGNVNFSAIDLDRDDLETAWQLSGLLPGEAFVERTRSGHFHVWSFFDRPLPAWVARFIMRSALEAAGQENVEVFPKTDTLRPGMLGNYINLPYPGDAPDDRQTIVDPLGNPVGLFDFLADAESNRADAGSWAMRASALGVTPPAERENATPFGEQENLHECALYIIEGARSGERPLAEGHRSKVLFALAKMLLNYKYMTLENARALLFEVNASGDRPLPASEVERILGTVLSGRYTSTSCDDPVVRPYARPDCSIARLS